MKNKFLPIIISNTIMFIAISLFISTFTTFFGTSNSLVGITVIVSALVLMNKDLTVNSLNNFLLLLILNVALGIIASIASSNMWFGLILNFLVLASMGYILSLDFTKTLILPFGLQYLFMIYSPVYGVDFTKRIAGLVFGAVFIMLLQYIVNFKNKNTKTNNSLELSTKDMLDYCDYINFNFFKINIKLNKVRFGYSIRIGILASMTAFLTTYFGLEQGRWMSYTVFSLTELYSENTKTRSIERVQSTAIGALIAIILFSIVKDDTGRSLILLLIGYLNPFFKQYKHLIILVTISAIAPIAFANGTITTAAIERVLFVIAGAIFALIANKFIFETKLNEQYEKPLTET